MTPYNELSQLHEVKIYTPMKYDKQCEGCKWADICDEDGRKVVYCFNEYCLPHNRETCYEPKEQ